MSEIYLVGGAVRDFLMGKESHDKDYVVVGSSPEEMLENGFEQVGADFPVFLHPETKDEYALARTERKSGNGYHGFETFFDSSVSIEEDLQRRDLTINAMAMDNDGNIIDPFNGKKDIENKVLRHVSEAFKEDPLRILRVARFATRFYGFSIAPETMDFMREMYDNGETKYLTKERIWKELSRAVIYDHGSVFFQTLQSVGVGKDLFPLMNGFMNDRENKFSVSRVHLSSFDENLKERSLKERVAQWSLPTYGVAKIDKNGGDNIADMWLKVGAPKEVVDHVFMSCSIWNEILNNFSSLKKLQTPCIELYDIIQGHDGFRRQERFLEAYDTVKNHFSLLSNNYNCIPDKSVIKNWIDKATPTKEEIANIVRVVDKKNIAKEVSDFKVEKWKKLSEEKPKFKMR